MLLFHGSKTAGIGVLKPSVSNHNVPLVYFSQKRENTLVYLSNAVEKFCKQNGHFYDRYYTWASYGFDKDGKLRVEEYYPNATEETYGGVSGYIYTVQTELVTAQKDIPFAFVSEYPVKVCDCEFVPDAYEAILKAEKDGLISILRYNRLGQKGQQWLRKTITAEYNGEISDDYKYFLENKFDFLKKKK